VGHHKGLAHAHAAFTKSFKGTQTEPVYELYRNGIVHGNLTTRLSPFLECRGEA
jgi:hypothetical protein